MNKKESFFDSDLFIVLFVIGFAILLVILDFKMRYA